MASTVMLRFFRYRSSILYGCRAPVVSNSMITTTGPLVGSGLIVGVSVEGPIASDSARVRVAGGASSSTFTGAADTGAICVLCSCVWEDGSSLDGVSTAASGSSCVVVFVLDGGSAADVAGNVLNSTGLVDKAAFPLLVGRELAGCGALGVTTVPVEGWWDAGVAMAGSESSASGTIAIDGGDWETLRGIVAMSVPGRMPDGARRERWRCSKNVEVWKSGWQR
jgi:hypothetical protein